jgi:hypothetical protein
MLAQGGNDRIVVVKTPLPARPELRAITGYGIENRSNDSAPTWN